MSIKIEIGTVDPRDYVPQSLSNSVDHLLGELQNNPNVDLTQDPIIQNGSGTRIIYDEAGGLHHAQLIDTESDGAVSSSSFGRTTKGNPYAFNNDRGESQYYDEDAIPHIEERWRVTKLHLKVKGQLDLGIFPSPKFRLDEDPMA